MKSENNFREKDIFRNPIFIGLRISIFSFLIATAGFIVSIFGFTNIGAMVILIAILIFIFGFILHISMLSKNKKQKPT